MADKNIPKTERALKTAETKRKNRLAKEKAKREQARRQKEINTQQARRLKAKAEKLKDWELRAEDLKDSYIEIIKENAGHIGNTVKMIGVSRAWYQKMIATDHDFMQRVLEALEESEDNLQHKLYSMGLDGNVFAMEAYFRRSAVQKANLLYAQRLQEIRESEVSLDKPKALKFAIKELLLTYTNFKANNKPTQAMYALKNYIELLELSEVGDLGEYEVLTGGKLIQIMNSLGIKPSGAEDINFEEVPDDMKDNYKDMFPQAKLETDGDKQ